MGELVSCGCVCVCVGGGGGGGVVGGGATLSNCFASFLKRSKIWQKYTKTEPLQTVKPTDLDLHN